MKARLKYFYCNLFLLNIYLLCCFPSCSQTNTTIWITQINNYYDSIENLKDVQTTVKAGAGVTLEYFISKGEVIKIIEQPSGYKYISAKETYYFQNNKPVYISADIEITNEDENILTIELQKIYVADKHIIKHLKSVESFNADSLYNNNPDPVKTSGNIRKQARFKVAEADQKFEKILFQAIENYLKARSAKDGDPVFNELYSPFI